MPLSERENYYYTELKIMSDARSHMICQLIDRLVAENEELQSRLDGIGRRWASLRIVYHNEIETTFKALDEAIRRKK